MLSGKPMCKIQRTLAKKRKKRPSQERWKSSPRVRIRSSKFHPKSMMTIRKKRSAKRVARMSKARRIRRKLILLRSRMRMKWSLSLSILLRSRERPRRPLCWRIRGIGRKIK